MARLGFVDQEGNVSHISSSSSYTPVKKKKKKDEEIKTINTVNKNKDIRTVDTVNKNKKTEETKKLNTVNADGYTETNKKYGDYYNDDESKNDLKIYKKDNKFYYKGNDGKYNEIVHTTGQSLQAVPKQVNKTPKEEKKQSITNFDNKKELKYKPTNKEKKEEKLSTLNQIKLDTADLTKEEKEKYKKSLIRQEQKAAKDSTYVRRGGAGLSGAIGELKNMGKSTNEKAIEPIVRAPQSYDYGKLAQQQSLEYYKAMMGKKNNLDEINKKIANYNMFNQDVINSNNEIDTYFKNLPNQVSGIKAGIKNAGPLGAIGAVGGGIAGAIATRTPAGALGGAEQGAKWLGGAGYVKGQAENTFKLEAGATYQTLLDMGVPQDIAKEEALKVGTDNALIESGESIVDLLTLGKGSIAVDKLKKGLLKKYGADFLENLGATYTGNIVTEAGQEGWQEQRGIAGEKRAAKKAGIERDNSQDKERILESIKSGAINAAITGGGTRVAGMTGGTAFKSFTGQAKQALEGGANEGISNNNANTVSSANQVREVNEIQQKAQNGEISYEQANQQLQEVQNGTYEQNRNLEIIAQQQVNNIQQAVQNGQISPVEATQEIQAVTNTLQNERERLNKTVQQETKQEVKEQPKQEVKKEIKEEIENKNNVEVGKQYTYSNNGRSVRYEVQELKDDGNVVIKINSSNEPNLVGRTITLKGDNIGIKNAQEYKSNIKYEDLSNDANATRYDKTMYAKAKNTKMDMSEYDKLTQFILPNRKGNYSKEQILSIAEELGKKSKAKTGEELKQEAMNYWVNKEPYKKTDSKTKYLKVEEFLKAYYKGAKVGEKLENKTKKTIENNTNDKITYNEKNNTLEINTDILQNVDKSNWISTLKDLLKSKFSKGIDVNGVQIEVTGKSRRELLSSSYTRWLKANDFEAYSDKMRMLDGLDKIYQNQKNIKLEDPKHTRTDDIVAFKRGNINVKAGNNLYNVDVLTGIRDNTGELVYDILNIKKEDSSIGVYPRSDKSSSEKNVSQKEENVNIPAKIETGEKPEILDKMPKDTEKKIDKFKKAIFNFRHHVTDHRAVFYDLAREYKNPTLYQRADAIDLSNGMAQVDIGDNQVDLQGIAYNNFTDEKGNKTKMSFEKAYDLYKKIPNKAKNEFLVHNLNMDRLNQGVEQFEGIDYLESEERVEQLKEEYPDIEKWAENIYQYNRNLLQKMVDSGRVSQQQANEWLDNTPHYVRIQRDMSDLDGNGVNSMNGKISSENLIQKVKGGSYNILPIKETTAQYTVDAMEAIQYNRFGKELAKTIGVESTGENTNQIDDIDEIFGIDSKIIDKDNKGNYSFTVYDKGVPITMPINEDMYKALKKRDLRRLITSKVVKAQREVITNKNPVFGLVTNPAKDVQDMFLYSKYSLPRSIATYGELFAGRTIGKGKQKIFGTSDGATTSDWVKLYYNRGNASNSYFNNGEFESSKNKVVKGINTVLSPIEKGNNFMESMPRITEFVNTIRTNGYTLGKDGRPITRREAFIENNKGKMSEQELQRRASKIKEPKKSLEDVLTEADYNAAEVTTNFKRGGTWSKNVDRNFAVYLSPSIQGAAKLGRTFTEAVGDAKSGDLKAAGRLVARAAILGVAPTILAKAMYGGDDDDEYDEIQDYQKDQYYLIKGDNGKVIRIPKGRAISLFQSATRRGIESAKGKEDAFNGYVQLVLNQVAPNNPLENNIFSPLVDVKRNESWSGNPIIPKSYEDKKAEEQYNEKTDELSKFISKQINKSDYLKRKIPKNFRSAMGINYILDQYSGVIGDMTLPSITPKATSDTSNPIKATIKNKFTFDEEYSKKSVSSFYDTKSKLTEEGTSENATPVDKAKMNYMNSQNYTLSDLYKKQHEIQNSKKLSKKEKYNQAKEVQKEINKFAEDSVKNVNNVKKEEYYMKIGDTYYKRVIEDGEEKFKKDSSKNIPTEGYALYDYFKKKYDKSKEAKK